jgi:KaiC/GvpD/RAD55 family RecA-like ATPase
VSRPPIDPYAPIPPRAGVNGAAHEPPAGFFDDGPEEAEPYSAYKAAEVAEAAGARPVTPSEIARGWAADGPLVRVATGFPTLDEACRGGFPVPWRVVIVGAPSAGKTALLIVIAQRMATDGGLCVGVLGVDEEPDDLNVRLAQMAGFTIAQCEGRDPVVLEEMAQALASVRVRFYDETHTIEAAADDVGAWATAEGRRAALVIDSLQTVRAAASADARNPRERVDANLRAVKTQGRRHRMLMISTSEANRGSYQRDDAAETSNDMAAGKESGSIEFSAQTLIMARTPKECPNHVHLRVPKNRRGARAGFEFFLRLDRDRHALSECGDPSAEPGAAAQRDDARRSKNRVGVEQDALAMAAAIRRAPGIGEVDLRAALRAAGNPLGVEKFNAAKSLLLRPDGLRGERMVDLGQGPGRHWYIEPAHQPPRGGS